MVSKCHYISVRSHHIFLQPRQDLQHQWLATQFQLFAAKIDAIIQDWPVEWKDPIVDDQLSTEEGPK